MSSRRSCASSSAVASRLIMLAAFAATVLSCAPRHSVPERFSSVADTLSLGKHFALADLGGEEDALLFTSGHRYIQKYTLNGGGGKLSEAGDILEVLDSLGYPLKYVINGDMICQPGDSLVEAAYDEWAGAEVLSFSPVWK